MIPTRSTYRRRACDLLAGVVAATAVAGSRNVPAPTESSVHFADADDQAQVTLSRNAASRLDAPAALP